MIDFEKVENAVKGWWETIGIQTVMEEEEQPAIDDEIGAICQLNIPVVRRTGHDEIRSKVSDDDPLLLDVTVNGLRVIHVSCTVDSISHQADQTARFYIEKGRTALGTRGVRNLLRGAGLALIETLPAVNAPFNLDDHLVSRCVLDLSFGYAACMPDEQQDTIGAFELQSNFTHTDGSPAAVQIDETITLP